MSFQVGPIDGVTALAIALLHSLWQGAVVAAAADVTLRMLHRRSAALRHIVAMGFLVSMALLPVWTFLRCLSQQPLDTTQWVTAVPPVPVFETSAGAFAHTMRGWAALLCTLWLLGVVAMLVRQAGGWWWVVRLDRRAFQPLPPQWLERLHALQHTMGISRTIVVRLADDVLVPFTARLFRPIIWIPRALLTRLSQSQLEALLAHELAHIRRLDWLWNGMQCVIEALLFFHPGAWWLSRRIREERECACDAMAANVCADPISLAEALAALAHERQPRPRLVLAANAQPLHDRINRLLTGASKPARSSVLLGVFAVMATAAVLAAPVGTSKSVVLRNTIPTRIVEFSTVPARVDPSTARISARRSPDSGGRAPDAVAATAKVSDRYPIAYDTESVARDRERELRNAEDALLEPEQASRDAELALRDPEQALRDAEHALRDPERALRDAEDALRGPEQSLRDAEHALRDREQATRDAEDASLGNEVLARYREQLARAREAVVPFKERLARAREAVVPFKERLARAREAVVPYRHRLARARDATAP